MEESGKGMKGRVIGNACGTTDISFPGIQTRKRSMLAYPTDITLLR
jgi:hypothetical protein